MSWIFRIALIVNHLSQTIPTTSQQIFIYVPIIGLNHWPNVNKFSAPIRCPYPIFCPSQLYDSFSYKSCLLWLPDPTWKGSECFRIEVPLQSAKDGRWNVKVWALLAWFRSRSNLPYGPPLWVRLKLPSAGLSAEWGEQVRKHKRANQYTIAGSFPRGSSLVNESTCTWIASQLPQLRVYPKALTVDNCTVSTTHNCLNCCEHVNVCPWAWWLHTSGYRGNSLQCNDKLPEIWSKPV